MPVDVQQRADAELGAAWRRCEAALPEGWAIDRVIRRWAGVDPIWDAAANRGNGGLTWGRGDTPAAALDALTEALANR